MKRSGKNMKWLAAFVLMTVCVLCMGFAALAEPGQVKITKGKGGSGTATLQWTKVSGARGYNIYYEKKNGNLKKVAVVKSGNTSKITIKKLTNNETYVFHVAAYDDTGEGPLSEGKSVMPTIANPGKVKQVRVKKNSNKRVYLVWDTNKKASGYQVFWLNESSGAYELIQTVSRTKTSCLVSNLKNGKTYYFKVRAFVKKKGQYGYGPMSATLVGRPVSYATIRKTAQVHPYYYSAKLNAPVTVGGVSLQKNAEIVLSSLGTATSKIVYYYANEKGKKVETAIKGNVPTSSFEVTGFYIAKKASGTNHLESYSKEVVENFVNIKGYQSPTPYLLWINTYTQHMFVFKGSQYNWQCVGDSPCCTGKMEKPTPLGVSQVYTGTKKSVVFFTTVSGTAVQGGFWGMRVAGGYIHSWLYNITNLIDFDWAEEKIKRVTVPDSALPTTLAAGKSMQWNAENFTKPDSSGCIRVTIAFAKWLYDNVPESTTCVTY